MHGSARNRPGADEVIDGLGPDSDGAADTDELDPPRLNPVSDGSRREAEFVRGILDGDQRSATSKHVPRLRIPVILIRCENQ